MLVIGDPRTIFYPNPNLEQMYESAVDCIIGDEFECH